MLSEAVLREIASGTWYLEFPLPSYVSEQFNDPLEYYERPMLKDFVKVDAVCVLARGFNVWGKVGLADIKEGRVNIKDSDVAIVEEKSELSYEALGQILVYAYLLETVWKARARKLIIAVKRSEKNLSPRERAVQYVCQRLSEDLELVISSFIA